jgi:CubicO group peptidase (beta-lactamase class C family)
MLQFLQRGRALESEPMKIGRRGLLGLALLGGLGRALARPRAPAPALDAELAAIADDPACQLASLSVLAIRRGKVAYQFQHGQRFLGAAGQPPRPADARTLYRIASISKMMTTLAAMRLVEQGKLALDADVSATLGFALRNPHFPDQIITLRTLLSHTSSLRDDAGYSWPCAVSLASVLTPAGAHYGSGAMWARNAPPGAWFSYANLGWGVIGTLMERASGERFDRLMERLLLEPLGLQGGFNPSEFSHADLANLATLYRKRTTDTEVWDPAGPWIAQVDDVSQRLPPPPAGIASYVVGTNATPFSPTGGLRMSAAGMGTVMRMLINDGVHEGRRILSSASLRTMFTRQWTYDGANGDTQEGLFRSWGLGNQHFDARLVEGSSFSGVGHLGEAYGLMSVFAVDLAARSGMVVLVGGVASDPAAHEGRYSSMARFEERILTALYRRVLA